MILIYRINLITGESKLIATADDSLREQVREWCKLRTAIAAGAGLSSRYVLDAGTDVQPFTAAQLAADTAELSRQLPLI